MCRAKFREINYVLQSSWVVLNIASDISYSSKLIFDLLLFKVCQRINYGPNIYERNWYFYQFTIHILFNYFFQIKVKLVFHFNFIKGMMFLLRMGGLLWRKLNEMGISSWPFHSFLLKFPNLRIVEYSLIIPFYFIFCSLFRFQMKIIKIIMLIQLPIVNFSQYIYIYIYCGAKGIGDPGPFHIKPMAHAEEEEMFENEQRKSRLPRYVAEDDLVLGRPRSLKGEVPRHQGESPRASQWKAQAPQAGHRGMAEK